MEELELRQEESTLLSLQSTQEKTPDETVLLSFADIRSLITKDPIIVTHTAVQYPSNMGIGFWNVKGNSIDNYLPWHSWMLEEHSIDVLVLIDSRDPHALRHEYRAHVQQELPNYDIALCSSGTPLSTSRLALGGITMLFTPRVLRCGVWSDPSGLGLIQATTFQTPSKERLLIIGINVPINPSNPDSRSLEAQLHAWLQSQDRPVDTLLYLRTILFKRISKHLQKPNTKVVLGGDFNMLSDEVGRLLLPDPYYYSPFDHPATSSIPTLSAPPPGRRVDHIFTWRTDIISHAIHSDEIFSTVSDHMPIWCHIPIDSTVDPATGEMLPSPVPARSRWTPKPRTLLTADAKAKDIWLRMIVRLLRADAFPYKHHIPSIMNEAHRAIIRLNESGLSLLRALEKRYPLAYGIHNDPDILLQYKIDVRKTLRGRNRNDQLVESYLTDFL